MSTVSTPLKYLFVAEYTDGSFFEQPADDRSKDHEDLAEHNKSAFGDVEQGKLLAFHLVEVAEPKTVYSVNLDSGKFAINGNKFYANDQNFEASAHELRLVFFREIQQPMTLEGMGEPFINRYFIGWQCTDKNGTNVQATIAVT